MEKGSQRLPVSCSSVFPLELWSDSEVLHNMVNDFGFGFGFYFDFDSSSDCFFRTEENGSLPDRDHCTILFLLREDVSVRLVIDHQDSHISHRSRATGPAQAGLMHSFYRPLDPDMDFLRDL